MTSDATAIQEAPPESGAYLEHGELLAALYGLSSEEKIKLHAIEAIYLRGTGFAPRGLVHEAVCRAIFGDRRCPKHVPIMAFLVMTMKSIASHDREQRWKTLQVVPRHGEAKVAPSDLPTDELNPEAHIMELQTADTVTRIYDVFQDDTEAQLVIMGWAEGLRGLELRDATGLDQDELDYAIKRIRTRMRKKYPNGWIP